MRSGSAFTGTKIPFDQINAAALAQLPSLVREWFPAGKRHGHEWRVGSINGEPGESFSVNMDTGQWAEFNGQCLKGGDVIGLHAAVFTHDRVASARELAGMLGIPIETGGSSARTGSKAPAGRGGMGAVDSPASGRWRAASEHAGGLRHGASLHLAR